MTLPVIEPAAAKLNLALHVTGRRADGYHLLDSLVCFAAYGDRVELAPGAASLIVSGPFGDGLQPDGDNLCLRAARAVGADARIALTKNLPVSAGLGGGSADAAAVLRALARLGHRLPDDLHRLGADVPVCLRSVPARMRGIGEILTPVPALPDLHLVLVNPGLAVSTPQVFGLLSCRDNPPIGDIPGFADPADLIAWLWSTRNDLEVPARSLVPAIDAVLAALIGTGAGFSRMSGSGASCFGIYDSAARAAQAAATLKQHGWWAVATELARPPDAR